MRRKKNKTGIAFLLLLLVAVGIGYAALSANLNINGTSNISANSWNVQFQNVNVTAGSVAATTAPTIDTSKLNINYAINLTKPGEFYEFTVDVANTGSINAKLSADPTISGLSAAQQKYATYTVSYSDGTAVKAGDTLNSGTTKTLKVRVEYKSDITASDLPTEAQSVNLTYSMNYVQA